MRHIPQRKTLLAFSALLVLGTIGGCASHNASNGGQAGAAPAATHSAQTHSAQTHSAQRQTFFMVHHQNGRLYAMTDPKLYLGLLENGEVPLTRTRIGAGPAGETVIFGITKADSKKLDKPTDAERIFDGKFGEVGAFYGEVVRNGRFHVFGEWKDFQDYLRNKEITFTYTEVGTGPKGETVIYALNKVTKKKGRPLALVEQFKRLRSK
ncbi:MAG: hypothetical protein R3E35_10920 [Rhodocyclaceae bacterium]|jgi:hypothetical protein